MFGCSPTVATEPHRVRQSKPHSEPNLDAEQTAHDTLYHPMGEIVQPFRRHPRYLLIALLVFVAQITLAFAHAHVHHQGSSWSQAASRGKTVPLPPDEDGDCRFCGAIHVASTLIPVASPDLSLPNTTYSVWLPICFARPLAAARASPFRSRAPPALINA
jgi:hypothetical protein